MNALCFLLSQFAYLFSKSCMVQTHSFTYVLEMRSQVKLFSSGEGQVVMVQLASKFDVLKDCAILYTYCNHTSHFSTKTLCQIFYIPFVFNAVKLKHIFKFQILSLCVSQMKNLQLNPNTILTCESISTNKIQKINGGK